MNQSLTLYTNPQSRGRIVRWMMEEVQQPYETVMVQYGPSMKSEDYLTMNPMGKVPTLKHGDTIVTECAAICAYMADAFPEAGLAPDAKDRGAYYRWLFFSAGPLEHAVTNKTLGVKLQGQQEAMVGYGNLVLVQNALEQALQKSPYIAGEKFTATDVYVGSHVFWGLLNNGLERRSAFVEYSERVSTREAAQRANELDGPTGYE